VASGGRTAEGQEKVHLYWRLKRPSFDAEVAQVCAIRHEIAAKVGGDPSFASAHQPIRVPGSIYRKDGTERLVMVLDHGDHAYDLAELAARAAAMPGLPGEIGAQPSERRRSVRVTLLEPVYADGAGGATRFEAISQVIGYWIRRQRDGLVTEDKVWEEISAYNEARVVPPWPASRLRVEMIRLWRRDDENQSVPFDGSTSDFIAAPQRFSEDGIAAELTRSHGDKWRYVAPWGQWLVWDGTRWRRENTLRIVDEARLVCRDLAHHCSVERIKPKLASAATVFAVERLARADRRHATTTDAWDNNIWRLNTPGGSVDLQSGTMSPHDPAGMDTKITRATPKGACPLWLEFLATVTGGDRELQAYLRRVVGYCLTGSTAEHALFFLYGTGANGKSVFVNTVAAILGDYAAVAPMDLLMAVKSDRHPTEMAGLRGARLVTATETEEGGRWAESKLKALTGGDPISARFMHRDFFEFVPQFKLIVAGNHKPAIRNVDEAMRRRLHLIPFTVTIAPAHRDKKLADKLIGERDGILSWAVEGCLEWRRQGLAPPATVVAATDEYFEAEDAFGRWIEECCERSSSDREAGALLFGAWKLWADANGEFVGSTKRFSETLRARGFEAYRDRQTRGFRGIRLRSSATDAI
jgi:P4 family phage/plasmid primase-like protien